MTFLCVASLWVTLYLTFLDLSVFDFGLFTMVRFDNGPCNATETETGICYTHEQCDEKGIYLS